MSQTAGLSRMPDYDGQRSHNALVAKLSRFASLSDDDVDVLEALCSKQERIDVGVNLVNEGGAPRQGFVITGGWPAAIGSSRTATGKF